MKKSALRYYSALKKVYPGALGVKPLVARNAVLKSLGSSLYVQNPQIYQKLYKEFYVFYSIFCQNTRDETTQNCLVKIAKFFKNKNYLYTLEDYKVFFYKHKDQSFTAMNQALNLLDERFYPDSEVTLESFLKIPRIGFKTSALIYNEFFEANKYPVVDVHALKGFNKYAKYFDLNSFRDPNKLYLLLCALSKELDWVGYDFASILYVHNRKCVAQREKKEKCKGQALCKYCEKVLEKLLKHDKT